MVIPAAELASKDINLGGVSLLKYIPVMQEKHGYYYYKESIFIPSRSCVNVVADFHGLLGPVPFTVIACTRALYSVAAVNSVTVQTLANASDNAESLNSLYITSGQPYEHISSTS